MFHGKRGCSDDINTMNWMKYSLSCVLQGTTAGWNMYAWLLGILMRPLVLTPQKGMRFCIFCRLFSYLALLTTRDWTISSMTTRFGSKVQFGELKCGMLQWWSNLKMLSTASMPFAACDLWSVLNLLVFIPIYDGIYTKNLVKTMTIATSVKLWAPYTHADIGSVYASPSLWSQKRWYLLYIPQHAQRAHITGSFWYLFHSVTFRVIKVAMVFLS